MLLYNVERELVRNYVRCLRGRQQHVHAGVPDLDSQARQLHVIRLLVAANGVRLQLPRSPLLFAPVPEPVGDVVQGCAELGVLAEGGAHRHLDFAADGQLQQLHALAEVCACASVALQRLHIHPHMRGKDAGLVDCAVEAPN